MDYFCTLVEQLKANGPIPELAARLLIGNLDRIEDFKRFDQTRGLPCEPSSFLSRHEQMARMRHGFAVRGLPAGVDRSLVWKAIEQGRHSALADTIWNGGVAIAPPEPNEPSDDSLRTLRSIQGPWGVPGAERGS